MTIARFFWIVRIVLQLMKANLECNKGVERRESRVQSTNTAAMKLVYQHPVTGEQVIKRFGRWPICSMKRGELISGVELGRQA